MTEILEVIIGLLAIWIYGSEDRPRHPIWRNSVRTIAFSGLLVSTASFLGKLGSVRFPLPLIVIWAVCSLVVIMAEYDLGSKKLCLAAFILYPLWLVLVIVTELP